MLLGLYLICGAIGGTLVLLSAFGGHDDGSGDGASHHDNGGSDVDASSIAALFSLRTLSFFGAFFGTTGLLLHYVADTEPWLGSVLATFVGVSSALAARFINQRTLRLSDGASGTVRDEDLIGKEATVTLDIQVGSAGRISLSHNGSTIELLATADSVTSRETTLAERQSVLIVEVKDGVARVAPMTHPFVPANGAEKEPS